MTLIARLVALAALVLLGLVGCKKESPPDPAPKAASAEASAAEAPTPSAEPVAEKQVGRPFLYQVRGVGEQKGSGWLLGTVHMGGDPDEDLDPEVWKRFETAKTVVIEADIGSIGAMDAARLAMLPPGQSLRDKLTAEQWEKLDDLTGIFVPSRALERMKPAFALALVVKELLPKTEPMDLVIQQRAKKADKKLDYLETVEEQIALMDEAIDAEVLAFSLDHADDMKERLSEMIDAYLGGDEARLVKAAFDPEEMKAHPEMFEKLFFARNARWVAKVEPLLREGEVFIAVGAGHLIGEKSLVELLSKQGWEIERFAPR